MSLESWHQPLWQRLLADIRQNRLPHAILFHGPDFSHSEKLASQLGQRLLCEAEQDLACGVAVGNMLLAAHAMGLGAVWRTGALAYHPVVRRGLALEENEHILAFLYVGHPAGERKAVPALDVDRFFTRWPAQD